MPDLMPMQLDIFEHSRDVMLRNDVMQALQHYQLPQARLAWERLHQEYPQERLVPELCTLIELLDVQGLTDSGAARFADHTALRQARLTLQDVLAPLARKVFGHAEAARWLRPLWMNLARRAAQLPFQAEHEHEHAAPLLLIMQDWPAAVQAIERIPSWRRIPAPLAWMAQAKLHQFGLQAASWPLLAELAWLAPKRLEVLVDQTDNPILQRLMETFELAFEDAGQGLSAPVANAAWFPAWVLIYQPDWVRDLALAQAGQHSVPEQAMRLLVEMLGLERQGRQRDAVAKRLELGQLHPWLLKSFLNSR
jgi:hypothetical protein